MVDPEEHALIERLKNGDPAPYARLVDTYQHMAYTIAYKILRNEEDTEDVAQESFIKAFQQIRSFKGQSKFSTWLYTIVFRTAVSRWNEKKLETVSIREDFDDVHFRHSAAPQVDFMQADDERRYIQKAINELPKTEAVMVTLYYINDSSVQEIHQITGYSIANIKIKLFRARKKLERSLHFLLQEDSKITTRHG